VLARSRDGLAAIAVEGKVAEPFGPDRPRVAGADAFVRRGRTGHPPSEGKRERLAFLCSNLGLAADDVAEARYQLVHRTVSALVEARRVCRPPRRDARPLVQQTSDWFGDYERFGAIARRRSEI